MRRCAFAKSIALSATPSQRLAKTLENTVPDRLPSSTPTLVIGAGVHGLSTAWHLARQGNEVLVVDKTDVAAGASGIACGIVRNNYFQPAMQELMAACVEVWESEPEALHYHASGYIALGPGAQEEDLTAVYERQQRIGYPSELHLGEREVAEHMRSLYHDWRAPGLTVCLHEHAGGYAFNRESMLGLADLARAAGARIETGVEVTGFESDQSGAVTKVHTSAGDIDVDQVVVAVGPWVPSLWAMLELPDRLDVRQPDGTVVADQPMWTYWYLQEGEAGFDPAIFVTDDGASSPVLHVDSDQPLHADDGTLITDEPWGVYFKPDRETIQGGAQPLTVGPQFQVDPYPTGTVDPGFPDLWSASLSHCLERFEGARDRYLQVRSGGAGAFTADNFPVFDYMRPNVFVAADSNHGYKMIAVGKEVARVLGGEHSSLLHPFRYERFATGDLHPVSHSPYPWS
jgi:glycine/D-amino acid oxidase-like deaminating enzyme